MLWYLLAIPTLVIVGVAGYSESFAKKSNLRMLNTDVDMVGKSIEIKSKRKIKDQLLGCQQMIDDLLNETNANPFMVRLAWHDSGTFDASLASQPWPKAGGAIGSIRFKPEIDHKANAGLANAVKLLGPIKAEYPLVSHADIFQMASARAIELAGGPKLDMRYGRIDAANPTDCSPEGNLPDGEANHGKYGGTTGTKSTEDTTAAGHLRKVFYRMGFTDEEIVALSGAHTIGRAHKDRSGLGATDTKFTNGSQQFRADGREANYKTGGSSWTKNWLKFDNSYFKTIADEHADPQLLKLSTDKALFDDNDFKPFAEKFRFDEPAFFESYAKAHVKLSELGSKFEPPAGIKLSFAVSTASASLFLSLVLTAVSAAAMY